MAFRRTFLKTILILVGFVIVSIFTLGLVDLAVNKGGIETMVPTFWDQYVAIFDLNTWTSVAPVDQMLRVFLLAFQFFGLVGFIILLVIGSIRKKVLIILGSFAALFVAATISGYLLVTSSFVVPELQNLEIFSLFIFGLVLILFVLGIMLICALYIYMRKREVVEVVEDYDEQIIIINNYYGVDPATAAKQIVVHEEPTKDEEVADYVDEDDAIFDTFEDKGDEVTTEETTVIIEHDNNVEEIVTIDEDGHVDNVEIIENPDAYQRKTFVQLLAEAEQPVRDLYNELKADFLAYGVKSRISQAGDTFRLHTKAYARIRVAGKGLKIYYALDPADYTDSTIPVKDSGNQKLYIDIPLTFKVKSGLSVKRAKQLFLNTCAVDEMEQKEIIELDYAQDAIDNHYLDDNDGSDEDID